MSPDGYARIAANRLTGCSFFKCFRLFHLSGICHSPKAGQTSPQDVKALVEPLPNQTGLMACFRVTSHISQEHDAEP